MLQEKDQYADSEDNSDGGLGYEVSYSIYGFRTTGGCGNDWGTHSEYVFYGTINGCSTGCVRKDAKDKTASTVSTSSCSQSNRQTTSKSLTVTLKAYETDAWAKKNECTYSWDDDCLAEASKTITMQDTNGAWRSEELCKGSHCVQYKYKVQTITASPTNAPTPVPVPGMWTATRAHSSWEGETTTDIFCGLDSDVFSIGQASSNWCQTHRGTTTQVIVNQNGLRMSDGWYCSDQGSTFVQAHPTFVASEGCVNKHHAADNGV